MITKIKNAVLVSDELIHGKNIYIKDGYINEITEKDLSFDTEIDAEGNYVSAGFIDIHTHGAGGYDFSDGEEEDILKAAATHAKHGTTTIYPTCTSGSVDATIKFLNNMTEAVKKNAPGRIHIAGAHLEGPYFSYEFRGAQKPEFLRTPQKEEYEAYFDAGKEVLSRISFAPELEGSEELADFLKENNILAAFAHTSAVYSELKPFLNKGVCLATHLYSGMNTVSRRNAYRYGGAVEFSLLEDEVTVEVIADGCHLPKELLQLIYKVKGADKICLVTDSMRAAGTDLKEAVLGAKDEGDVCVIKDGVAFVSDMTAFAGSVATADRLIRVMYKLAEVPLCDAVKMITKTPARVMGLSDRGILEKGYIADLVIFDDDINIKKVIIKGEEL